jgi:2-polyprenyl-6-methoxyphenol hydroxylase-like FAD-dependent oxidoreductase
VLRANFDSVSSDYVDAAEDVGLAKYEYGCNVTNVAIEGRQIVVTYTDRDKNEQTTKTDRVFAADGPSSSIRSMFAPKAKRTYAGYVLRLLSDMKAKGRLHGEAPFPKPRFQKPQRRLLSRNSPSFTPKGFR